MDKETFLSLGDEKIADIVAVRGPHVVVCPINGTRRWYYLEHPDRVERLSAHYLDTIARKYIEIFKLFFDHGIYTILTPAFGPDLLEREPEYLEMAAQGLGRIVDHPEFTSFYETYDLSVGVYGDYKKHFEDPSFGYLKDLFDRFNQNSQNGKQRRQLLWGLFAHDATETIAEIAVEFFQKEKRLPSRRELVRAYYGEFVENVDLFIGFDKFAAFDMPLISVGSEDLYFLASPTPYLEREHLREILYDHIFLRPMDRPYHEMDKKGLESMRAYYAQNRKTIFGVGRLIDGIWYPSALEKHRLAAVPKNKSALSQD